jgi:hypothetical protein
MNLGSSLGSGTTSGEPHVLQTDFKKAKIEIKEVFLDVKEELQ